MTYPDLVPAISGFMELFFIEVFDHVILFGRQPGLKRRSGPSYRKGLKKAVGDVLCQKVPCDADIKTVYDSGNISGQRI